MKRKFYQIAKRLGVEIISYLSYREPGMGGLQVFELKVKIDDNNILRFDDSYFHLSGDAPKIIKQFEYELINKQKYITS